MRKHVRLLRGPSSPTKKYSYLDGSIPKHLIVICHPHVTMSIHGEIRCESQIVAAFYMAERIAHVHVGPVYVVRSCHMSYLHSILCHFSGSISGCTFVLASQYMMLLLRTCTWLFMTSKGFRRKVVTLAATLAMLAMQLLS